MSARDPETPIRPIRSYVLRMGRMTEAQRRAYEVLGPRFCIPFSQQPIDLGALFGRAAPKILEIGFGMGETTAQLARIHPENDYLAVEVHTPGVGSLLKRIAEHDIGNIRIIQHDAIEVLSDMITPATLSGVYLFFPDPWPKKRHHKRRLIKPEFVSLVADRLRPGGNVHAATDWEDYAREMLEMLSAEPRLENTAQGFARRPDYRPLTKFETRGLKLGHPVRDLIFRRKEEL